MGGTGKEACGRCSVSTVIEVANEGDRESGARNPFDGERIELEESQMRSVVKHEVLFSRISRRLDEFATKIIYG
ncbi:MAG: hypothetical protein ACOCQ3_02215 [Natronomonas sp.]